jgi:co-chaperonin GroES (HSP10)
LFNDRHNQPGQTIYGAVSTGTNWKFLKLNGTAIEIDLTEYFILQLPQILGILALPFGKSMG